MLSEHRQIWLPHLKELHYFDRKFPIGSFEAIAPARPSRSILSPQFSARLRRLSVPALMGHMRSLGRRDLTWEFRYQFGEPSDAWYASLFDNARDRVPGEITPAYSCLDDAAISHIHSLMPDARLILLLRDPIERAWSHARMDLAAFGRQPVRAIEEARYREHFASFASRRRGSYPAMIDRWLTHYPGAQLFIGFYDEILSEPEALLVRLFRFLDVSATSADIPPGVRTRVNAGPDEPIPETLHRSLAQLYVDDLGELSRRFGSYPQVWLERCQRALQQESDRR
jgi:hypothetical protein